MLFGKMIMILSDLLVGLLVVKILSFLRKKGRRQSVRDSLPGYPFLSGSDIFYTSLWLLNPFVINVSTRFVLFNFDPHSLLEEMLSH